MPTLTLKFKKQVIDSRRLEKVGGPVTIGRSSFNDLVIDNLAVSGRHAKIESVDHGFLLTDLGSRNGTFLNRELVTSHWLRHGDVITIGKHSLVFEYEEWESPPRPDQDPAEADEAILLAYGEATPGGGAQHGEDLDRTMVLDTDSYRNLLVKNMPKLEKDTISPETPGILTFVAGGRGEFELGRQVSTIGKADSCQVSVRGFLVGRVAATINRKPDGYYLNHTGGIIKPKLNGSSIKGEMRLQESDIIKVGHGILRFSYKRKPVSKKKEDIPILEEQVRRGDAPPESGL